MVSRTALLFVALAGVTLCVTANADAGLESSAAFGSDALETVEGTSGRSLLGKNKPSKPAPKPKFKPDKYLVYQNAQNTAVIIDIDTQVVIGNGNVVSNYGENTINQSAENQNKGRKLLTAPKPTPKPAPVKYIVFQNAQNKAVIYDNDVQAIVGKGNFVYNQNSNTINQEAENKNYG